MQPCLTSVLHRSLVLIAGNKRRGIDASDIGMLTRMGFITRSANNTLMTTQQGWQYLKACKQTPPQNRRLSS